MPPDSGAVVNNTQIGHQGLHCGGINLYEVSRDIRIEGNYLSDIFAMNRIAGRITLSNNIVDLWNRPDFRVSMWVFETGQNSTFTPAYQLRGMAGSMPSDRILE